MPLRRIVIESVVIVSSILLAFGIDTWWAELREAGERRAAIDGLVQDFRSNLAGLDRMIDGHSTVVRMSHAVETRPEAVRELPSDSIFQYVAFGMAWWGTFDSQTGTLDGLIASGSFDLVADPELRTQLLAWQSELADSREEGSEFMAQTMRTADRLGALGGPWTGIDLAGNRPEWGEEFSLNPPLDVARLLSDERLLGLLRHRHMLSLGYLRELLPLRDRTQEILLALEAAADR